jgi:hypothetical protein
MRVAALYDIHGNVAALDAVLRETREEDVDLIVVGGDVLPGPMPRETLECLTASDIPIRCIHGNGDRVVAAQVAGGDINEVPERFREVIRWTAQQLELRQRVSLANWPPSYQVEISDSGKSSFVMRLLATTPKSLLGLRLRTVSRACSLKSVRQWLSVVIPICSSIGRSDACEW